MEQSGKLPVKVKLGFGVCDLGGNLYFTVVAFWLLNYLTDTLGLAAGLAGTAIMIGKIWDAVTDPMVGWLSDRTRSRWGRRRPYILFGALPLGVMMVVMFTNPGLESQSQLFVWALVTFCLLGTALTLVNIPYSALTPELTRDFHERTSLNGYRSVFMVLGTLLGAGAALPLVGAFASKTTGWTVAGSVFGAVMTVTALITFFSVREPAVERPRQQTGFLSSYLLVFKNRAFLSLLSAFLLHITAVTLVSGIMVFYFKYIYQNEAMTTLALLVLLVTTMVFIPVSVRVSRRLGKMRTYFTGLLIIAAACLGIFGFAHIWGMPFFFAASFVAGVGLSTTYTIPWSMIPDTVEYDVAETGTRREGAYYGIWTFVTKIGQALAGFLSGWVLALSGFVAEAAQAPRVLLWIRLIIGPLSALLFVAAAAVLLTYPITEGRYREILARIAGREAGGEAGR
jgi:GPH family glycoside/pentoside/hexuronide:cation symporter